MNMLASPPDHTPATRRELHRKSTKIRLRRRRIAGSLVLGAVFAGLLIWGFVIMTDEPAHSSVGWCTDAIADAGGVCHGEPVPPCPTEDSTDCYWDADVMGNGHGRSFVDVAGRVYFQDVK